MDKTIFLNVCLGMILKWKGHWAGDSGDLVCGLGTARN